MRLYTQIVLVVSALLLLASLALGAALINVSTASVIHTSQRNVEAIAQVIADASMFTADLSNRAGRNESVQQIVDRLTGHGDIAFIRVVNENNATLAASSTPLAGYDYLELQGEQDWGLINRAQRENKAVSEYATDVIRAAAALTDQDGRLMGAVFVYQTTDRVRQAQNEARTRSIQLGLLSLVIGAAVSMGLARLIVQPLERLEQVAQALAQGDWQHQIRPSRVQEINALGQAFTAMANQIRATYASLEEKVAERTRELERRVSQIATGAEISRAASQELDPKLLMQQVVDLIRERFDFYYVALFMLDEAGKNAVLRAGTGKAGRIMLERQHKLEVGDTSMIGWACAHKQARIALDVGDEPVRFANPLLPQTHSEMALPLRIGDKVIGALSIQSELPAAFDANDITALQGMADQIAVALENARLFQQAQTSLQELEQANRLLSQQGWQAFLRTRPPTFAEFHQAGVAPFTPEEVKQAGAQPPTRATIPIQVRGQIIGTLVAERSADQPQWSEADLQVLQAAVAQAAQAMDSARLFDASQRLAARERLVSRISSRMRESLDLETMLRTTADEIYQALGLERVAIRLAASASQPRPAHEE